MKAFFCIGFTLFFFGCAGQRLPEGGPVDTIPPEIISIYPQPNTINFAENKVIVEFSEYVDRRSVEDAIFISPAIENVEYDWSGTELEIIFNEQLRQNTTYVITIGTDVIDVRARNRMGKAFTLAFSTGSKIDNGTIAGKVFDEKPEGVMIFSYRLNKLKIDTLNPAITKPDYLTQTGKTGEFFLTNIVPGSYRIYAIRDEYRNLLYDPETDAAGTTDDVILTEKDTLVSNVEFTLAKEDTTSPRISSIETPDNNHVVVKFSESLDSTSIKQSYFQISDTLLQNPLAIKSIFPNSDQYNAFTLVTSSQKENDLYLLQIDSVKDNAGFVINPLARTKQFKGGSHKDTVPPSLIFSTIRDSSTKILPSDKITFTFNDAIQHPVTDTTFGILRRRDSTNVSFYISVNNPSSVTLTSALPYVIGERYQFVLRWNGIKDIFGNVRKDSISKFYFLIDDPENYGSIEGMFVGYEGSSTIIQASNIVDKKQIPAKRKITPDGKFVFHGLPEGRYTIKAFDDRNMNEIQDAGKVFPFQRSEKFTLYPDTVRVRPRWPVDGVIFKAK